MKHAINKASRELSNDISRCITRSSILTRSGSANAKGQHRSISASPMTRWRLANDLDNQELSAELVNRKLNGDGSRQEREDLLVSDIAAKGGYDNGLTTDSGLVQEKKIIESAANALEPSQWYEAWVCSKPRHQKILKRSFAAETAVEFGSEENKSLIKISGPYSKVIEIRAAISDELSEIISNETVFSFPAHFVKDVMEFRKGLMETKKVDGVNISILRVTTSNEDDAYILSIQGGENRQEICALFAGMLETLKIQYHEELNPEQFNPAKRQRQKNLKKKKKGAVENMPLRGFCEFEGSVLYMDLQYDLNSLKESFDQIENKHMQVFQIAVAPCASLPWLKTGEIAIEGSFEAVNACRKDVDTILNNLRSNTLVTAFPECTKNVWNQHAESTLRDYAQGQRVDLTFHNVGKWTESHINWTNKGGLHRALLNLDSFIFRTVETNSDDGFIGLRKKRDRIRHLDFVELGIGGLGNELKTLVRRTFESRLIPDWLRVELSLEHVKGVLLYGAPGTGKTLIARNLAKILGCKDPKVINGPELLSKWVGEAEKNMRGLFADAEKSWAEEGSKAELHVIIFDEIDAFAKSRGGPHAKSKDGPLNQLLCCIDGVNNIGNVVVFALTNRKDCLDPALLRPGRLEVQLEVSLPDVFGREEILRVHTGTMSEHKRLAEDVDIKALADFTEGFSGADLAGMVRSAVSFALNEIGDDNVEQIKISALHFEMALQEMRKTKEAEFEVEDELTSEHGIFQA